MRTTEESLRIAQQLTEEWMWETRTSRPEAHRIDVEITSLEDLVPIAVGLRVQGLGYLSAITGLDSDPESQHLEVLYHFCAGEAIITLRARVPRENPEVPSLTGVIPGADAFERELREMFGIAVSGLRHPGYLYLPDEWPEGVYPQRKDIEGAELTL
jgi:Ni,Fe-hydrogenase III component G